MPPPCVTGLDTHVWGDDLSGPFPEDPELWALLLVACSYRHQFYDLSTLSTVLMQVLLDNGELDSVEYAARQWYAQLGAADTTLYERRSLMALDPLASRLSMNGKQLQN